MKLLLIGGGYRFWGMEQALLTLQIGLRTRGVECAHVVSGWSDGAFAERLKANGIEVYPLKLGRFYVRRPSWTLDTLRELPGAITQLRTVVRAYRPDAVIHLDNRLFLIAYPALFGLPCKHVYREAVIPSAARVDRLAYSWIFSACSLVIVNSETVRERFGEIGLGSKKTVVIANGTDCKALKPSCRTRQAPIRIGIVGQAIVRKGHDVLLRAFRDLLHRGHDIRLVIVGDSEGAFAETIKACASKWGIDHFITWAGVVEDKAAIYDQVDIIAIPSRSDAFPNVALEAGAAGLPVVASRAGGAASVINDGETGLLVEQGSAEQLGDALARLLNEPALRTKMGAAARRRIEGGFSAERMTDKYLRALATII